MNPTAKPAIVIVHGAWHQPAHFEAVVKKLEVAGHEVVAPALPSCNDIAIDGALKADVGVVRDAIETLVLANKDVILVAHSYGGIVVSEALAEVEEKRLQSTIPAESGRILHAFYISAFIVKRGTSLIDQDSTRLAIDISDGLMYILEPYNRFFNTTELPKARKAIQGLKSMAAETFATPTKYQGWSDYGIPITYLACKQDRAIMFDVDTPKFISNLDRAGIKDLTKKILDADHSPWMSQEAEFMDILWDVIKRASNGAAKA